MAEQETTATPEPERDENLVYHDDTPPFEQWVDEPGAPRHGPAAQAGEPEVEEPVAAEEPVAEPAPKPTHEFDKVRQQDQIARANAERYAQRLEQQQQILLNQLEAVKAEKAAAQKQDDDAPIEDYDKEINGLKKQLRDSQRELADAKMAVNGIVQQFQEQAYIQKLNAANTSVERELSTLLDSHAKTFKLDEASVGKVKTELLGLARQEASALGYTTDDQFSDTFPPLPVQRMLLKNAAMQVRMKAMEAAMKAKDQAAPRPVKRDGIRMDDGRAGRSGTRIATRGKPADVLARMKAEGRGNIFTNTT